VKVFPGAVVELSVGAEVKAVAPAEGMGVGSGSCIMILCWCGGILMGRDITIG